MAKVWLVLFLLTNVCFAQFPAENERLMATARLWITVDYFHPYISGRDIDWDLALVTAIPKVRAATNRKEYVASLSSMLDELHDPETRVVLEGEPLLYSYAGPASLPQVTVLKTAADRAFLYNVGSPLFPFLMEVGGATASLMLYEPVPFRTNSEGAPRMTLLPSQSSAKYVDAYPPVEARLLAAIKLYGAIHYFFAYKDLMDEDWEEIFPTYLSKFIAAKDATEYNLVLSDLLTHLTDTNVQIQSKTINTYFGEAPVGLHIRLLDKYPIVTEVLDPAAKAAGIQPGDVVKRIGGISTTDLFNRFVPYIPASTPQRSGYDTIQKVINGPPGSQVELVIENSKGEAHPVTLTRTAALSTQRTTEAIRILPGNIGYLDLERLTETEADSALTKLKDTRAIIFDLRSATAPAATNLASHLTTQRNLAAEIVTTPIALHPDVPTEGIATQTASTFVVRTLPHPREPYYKGKTIALIDERTIGESEHAALLFEAANKTEFIGAPSAGAYSKIAELHLPGEITVTYSTEDIRHANGGKLQRLGIQPNILAPTTAKGLHAGKDEPLEAALSHLAK